MADNYSQLSKQVSSPAPPILYTGILITMEVIMRPDIKGLTKLADHLHNVPRKDYEGYTWIETSPCGTKACIAGHAALLFPSRFKKIEGDEWEGNKYFDVVHRRTGAMGGNAFADGFHISEEDAIQLTENDMDSKSTPKKAARAVRALIGKLEREAKAK